MSEEILPIMEEKKEETTPQSDTLTVTPEAFGAICINDKPLASYTDEELRLMLEMNKAARPSQIGFHMNLLVLVCSEIIKRQLAPKEATYEEG